MPFIEMILIIVLFIYVLSGHGTHERRHTVGIILLGLMGVTTVFSLFYFIYTCVFGGGIGPDPAPVEDLTYIALHYMPIVYVTFAVMAFFVWRAMHR